MKLSTKGRYGTRAMLDLGLYYNKGPVLLKEIAKRQEISAGYLEHLMLSLKASGLVRTIRGAHGGYILAKPPSEIRLKEIVESLEGSLAPVDCVDDSKLCQRANFCVTREIWTEIKKVMVSILASTTLQDLVKRQRGKRKLPDMMYNI